MKLINLIFINLMITANVAAQAPTQISHDAIDPAHTAELGVEFRGDSDTANQE